MIQTKQNNVKLDYSNFEGFENIYLEDSYVLEIKVDSESVKILIDAVLIEQHPFYSNPKTDEQYCYRRIMIHFPNARNIVWKEGKMSYTTNINGTIDFGNIDKFYLENDFYHLSGDWEELKIESAKPTIEYIENKQ